MEGDEGSYLPNCQTNLVIACLKLSLGNYYFAFYKFLQQLTTWPNTYEPSSLLWLKNSMLLLSLSLSLFRTQSAIGIPSYEHSTSHTI